MKRQLPSPEAQKKAFKEAIQRIELAERAEAAELGFQDLEDLSEIPQSISRLKSLKRLNFEDTCISDLSPLEGLTSLQSLDLDDTLVMDLSPLSNLDSLITLYVSNTLVDDLQPISNLNLYTLLLGGTRVRDLTPISGMINLRSLVINKTKISDLSPIKGFSKLEKLGADDTMVSDVSLLGHLDTLSDLSLDRTPVSDLTPLKDLPKLFTPYRTGGISFVGCENLPDELKALSKLRNPGRTMKVGEFMRNSELGENGPDEEFVSLAQRPAPYSFTWRDGLLHALPHTQPPFDERLADEVKSSISEKISDLLSLLSGNAADGALRIPLEAVLAEISKPAADVRDGVLLMRFRSIQAASTVYFSSDAEIEELLRTRVIDISLSLEDLLALYPGIRTIDANRQALNFQGSSNAIASYRDLADQIVSISQESPVISASAIIALKDGSAEIDVLTEVIALSPNEAARASAIEKRAAIASLQILGLRNFIAAPLRRAYEEIAPVFGESWKQAKIAIPVGVGLGVQGVVSGAIRGGAAMIAGSLAGPIAGLALLVASFAPLAKAAAAIRAERGKDEASTDDEQQVS